MSTLRLLADLPHGEALCPNEHCASRRPHKRSQRRRETWGDYCTQCYYGWTVRLPKTKDEAKPKAMPFGPPPKGVRASAWAARHRRTKEPLYAAGSVHGPTYDKRGRRMKAAKPRRVGWVHLDGWIEKETKR